MQFQIDAGHHGCLLRDYLKRVGVSAALCAKLKRKEQGMLLNGNRVTVRAVLSEGDVLELAVEDEKNSEKILPMAFTPEMVLETPDFAVVNKPPYMPTHPSHGHFADTLANALVYHYGGEGNAFCPRFINRLDRNTSGAVLVARHALAAAALSRSMTAGEMEKGYLALVEGAFARKTILKTGIRRREESIIFREVCDEKEGDVAITVAEPLAVGERVTLVRLSPQTGRTHQLRVHMAYLGHPILGDALYGNADPHLERHALHAAELSFPDPKSRQTVRAFAPLPQDMRERIQTELGEEGIRLAESAFL